MRAKKKPPKVCKKCQNAPNKNKQKEEIVKKFLTYDTCHFINIIHILINPRIIHPAATTYCISIPESPYCNLHNGVKTCMKSNPNIIPHFRFL